MSSSSISQAQVVAPNDAQDAEQVAPRPKITLTPPYNSQKDQFEAHPGYAELAQKGPNGRSALDGSYHKHHSLWCRTFHPQKQELSNRKTAEEMCIDRLKTMHAARASLQAQIVSSNRSATAAVKKAEAALMDDDLKSAKMNLKAYLRQYKKSELTGRRLERMDQAISEAVEAFHNKDYIRAQNATAIALREAKGLQKMTGEADQRIGLQLDQLESGANDYDVKNQEDDSIYELLTQLGDNIKAKNPGKKVNLPKIGERPVPQSVDDIIAGA